MVLAEVAATGAQWSKRGAAIGDGRRRGLGSDDFLTATTAEDLLRDRLTLASQMV